MVETGNLWEQLQQSSVRYEDIYFVRLIVQLVRGELGEIAILGSVRLRNPCVRLLKPNLESDLKVVVLERVIKVVDGVEVG